MERLKWLVRVALALLTLESAAAASLPDLMAECAPSVHPSTLAQIIRQESGGEMFVLSDDGPANLPWSERKGMLRSFSPASKEDAATIVKELVASGHIVGVGPMQVSSRHFARLGLTVEDALDPCRNLKAGSAVLVEFYLAALTRYKEPGKALVAAISAYNTGDFYAGIANGYVGKVLGASPDRIPELKVGQGTLRRTRLSSASGNARGAKQSDDARSERAARLASATVETF